ncbi:polysaccharide deacetylase family protein, partial [Anaerocolumna sp.]|uniref:polysaccharide deacetylase family protein n=1 Tax=Anaerocolumna sp. TaxID=2041569 RepID=UPI0028A7E8C7
FFVRTNYLQDNPNLLRAIAEAGHAIGSHTDGHLPYAITTTVETEDDTSAIYTSPSEAEIIERKEDLNVSYQKLQNIVGDIQINGMPALTKIFRPPTLAMSREGMEAIFDMGFQFIVSGDFSTHDYEETSADSLADTLINGISLNDGNVRTLHNGSVLVLHMSDDSVIPTMKTDVTAKALDIAIPQLMEQGYRFARLNDYLSESSKGIYPLEQSMENEIMK